MTRERRHARYGRLPPALLPEPDDYERGYLRGYFTGVLLVLALLALAAGIAALLAWLA
jgi:hypothetical protein